MHLMASRNLSRKTFARPDVNASDVLVLKTWVSLGCGGFAGAISQTVSFPFDVTRRRMQLANVLPDSHKYKTMWTTLASVYVSHSLLSSKTLSQNLLQTSQNQAATVRLEPFHYSNEVAMKLLYRVIKKSLCT